MPFAERRRQARATLRPALALMLLIFVATPGVLAQPANQLRAPTSPITPEADNVPENWGEFWRIPIDVFNLFIACFGALQFWIYWRQAKIMRQQKEIAEQQAEFNRLLPTITHRALIAYDGVRQEREPAGNAWIIDITWRNYGQTPANSIQISEMHERVQPGDFARYVARFPPPAPGMHVTVAPGRDFLAGRFRMTRAILTGGDHAICGCRVYYRDVFQPAQVHQSSLCFDVVLVQDAQGESLEFRVLGGTEPGSDN